MNWKEWLKADILERKRLVKKLILVQDFADFKWHKLGRNQREDAIATMLNEYFEDLAKEVKK